MENRRRKVSGIIVTVFVVLLALTIAVNCVKTVPTGYTGVRTTFGQIDQRTVPNGINFKLPFIQSIELVNNKQQDITDNSQIWSETSERTAIYYENITVTYQISPDASAWIYSHVTNYENNLVTSQLIASSIKAASKGLNDTDATNRGIIEPLVQQNLQKSVDEKYKEGIIVINKVTISNVDFDESYNQAIANKQRASIEAQQQAIENQKAIERAEAEAKVKKTEAQAEAEATLIRAQAEAEANEILQKSITSEILQQEYIEKWDGALPKVMTGDNGNGIMIGVDSMLEDGKSEANAADNGWVPQE